MIFHGHGPNSCMVFVRENPSKLRMITRGSPLKCQLLVSIGIKPPGKDNWGPIKPPGNPMGAHHGL